jgi:hypothetical protein
LDKENVFFSDDDDGLERFFYILRWVSYSKFL